jgi:hypothetical protein
MRALILVAAFLWSLSGESYAGETVAFSEMTDPVRSLADATRYEWLSVNTAHCRIYFEKDTFAAKLIREIEAECEKGINRSLEFLGEQSYSVGLRVFVVATRDELIPVAGARYKAFALMGQDAVVMAHNPDVRMYAVHEIFHIVSGRTWGDPVPWLREGAAVYVDGECLEYEQPFHSAAAYLKDRDNLFEMQALTTDFYAAMAESDLRAYLQAGSFVQYLYENYGRDAVKRYWRSQAVETTEAFGKSLEELEEEWLQFLGGVDFSTIDWDELEERGCG